MFCIKCGENKIKVINSRPSSKSPSVWRRRQCTKCGFTFTTYEEIAFEQLEVVNVNGVREAFSDTRLLLSIAQCLEHESSKKPEYAKWLSKHVIAEILRAHNDTISIQDIIKATYKVLSRFDQLASIQYAARHKDILKAYLRRLS